MTSLIFGTIYMGHKGLVHHKREKQRQKNYERWEGLRDEYDEQRKINRQSRSLDIQRTGAVPVDEDRPILTLRDQQEAGDARTGWRPQEAFDGVQSVPATDNRRSSVEVTAGSSLRPLTGIKTGTTWDEGLPSPLKVSRRNWDDYQPSNSGNISRSSSVRNTTTSNSATPHDRSASNTPSLKSAGSPTIGSSTTNIYHPHPSRIVSTPADIPHYGSIDPIDYSTPGGPMAELIAPAPPNRPAPTAYTNHQPPQTFAGYQSNPFLSLPAAPAPTPSPVPAPLKVQPTSAEFWDRP
ncbi:hypothetical protein PV08_08475 [Exophiala spinifera]|uniref:Uncharacterized protein n=1 Tax=Exophiala spinifera TaxID=91928 RepID=A0A0D1ZKC2_9EURO|nr:uncharacterized protein PV08_08475 [Exophiala spinifera]KIW13287.1 hypothetical protein PV08_08475 [Exophiala spinifera]